MMIANVVFTSRRVRTGMGFLLVLSKAALRYCLNVLILRSTSVEFKSLLSTRVKASVTTLMRLDPVSHVISSILLNLASISWSPRIIYFVFSPSMRAYVSAPKILQATISGKICTTCPDGSNRVNAYFVKQPRIEIYFNSDMEKNADSRTLFAEIC